MKYLKNMLKVPRYHSMNDDNAVNHITYNELDMYESALIHIPKLLSKSITEFLDHGPRYRYSISRTAGSSPQQDVLSRNLCFDTADFARRALQNPVIQRKQNTNLCSI